MISQRSPSRSRQPRRSCRIGATFGQPVKYTSSTRTARLLVTGDRGQQRTAHATFPSPALAEQIDESAAHRFERGDLVVEVRQFRVCQRLDVFAPRAVDGEPQQIRDIGEREAELLRSLDETNNAHRILRVGAITGGLSLGTL